MLLQMALSVENYVLEMRSKSTAAISGCQLALHHELSTAGNYKLTSGYLNASYHVTK